MAASFVSGLQSSGAEVAFALHSARLLIQRISAPTSRQELNWISKNLIEVLPAAVYVCNLEGVVVAFNRRNDPWVNAINSGDIGATDTLAM